MFSAFQSNPQGLKRFSVYCLILLLLITTEAKADNDNIYNIVPPIDVPQRETNEKLPFSLPPPAPPGDHLSTMEALFVKKIILEGNTVFSNADLSTIIKKYENRGISAERLQALRLALTTYYVDRGYINSGVVIPDQKIENGVIRLLVMEGKLGKTIIMGNQLLREQYIRNRLDPEILTGEKPLNIFILQRDLKLLKEDPHIETILARVVPGKKRGKLSFM